ncbi:MAG: Na(+)-translocating NADH-quinone reductase subunit C [Pseudomonadales bacterium]|jgi:Na+-transporting NADH:ubiquinone oxidoreductase subunit C|nr:Na(+)-translocating NADH-quinone reductase subunit C [Pseudomonadales bacterium]MDP4641175.1 Na(+)-translocating NADH-quinone reductase subunit C [Pseudomonadales bacterium]MDP4765247.1 Na(+)-translocating NADH-quinone reductase subunit C [Pseudomonadales bacterium]MDP4874431.1 Na(+)-translocating NADH-quinone reductase subunit C [Pseudomonadales bacterium]MDP4910370.1 Na(+)-translocating NADH-quinone reductase subunit C [Pseudomonadales bacterium]
MSEANSDKKPEKKYDKDSIKNVVVVAMSLCFVCAIIVSTAAVQLKPQRIANKELDRNKNILIAAGLYAKGVTSDSQIDKLFEQFTIKVVDLQEKKLLSDAEVAAAGIDIKRYDQRKAAKDPSLSIDLEKSRDIASISRRARYSVAYLLEQNGTVDRIVLPVHGYGLWSTLYGFIALEGDANTVAGITFYEQQETAGLGGEVDNPKWKGLWAGKEIYADGKVVFEVIKGSVDPASAKAIHQVDGLSGASITSRGVQNLITFWLGDDGFGPVLKQLQG